MKFSARRLRARRADGIRLPERIKRILEPYFPDFDLDRIRVFEGIPWYVTMDPDAYTDGNNIFFRPGCFDPDSIEGIGLLGHEVAHAVQYGGAGKWQFRARYLGDWSRKLRAHRSLNLAYFYNHFEEEAREIELRIVTDLLERHSHDEDRFRDLI